MRYPLRLAKLTVTQHAEQMITEWVVPSENVRCVRTKSPTVVVVLVGTEVVVLAGTGVIVLVGTEVAVLTGTEVVVLARTEVVASGGVLDG